MQAGNDAMKFHGYRRNRVATEACLWRHNKNKLGRGAFNCAGAVVLAAGAVVSAAGAVVSAAGAVVSAAGATAFAAGALALAAGALALAAGASISQRLEA